MEHKDIPVETPTDLPLVNIEPPSIVQPPVTQINVDSSPVTQPPVTQVNVDPSPVTQPPVTQVNVDPSPVIQVINETQPSLTQPSLTQPSLTQPSLTQVANETQPIITQVNVDLPPVTQPSLTQVANKTQPSLTQPIITQVVNETQPIITQVVNETQPSLDDPLIDFVDRAQASISVDGISSSSARREPMTGASANNKEPYYPSLVIMEPPAVDTRPLVDISDQEMMYDRDSTSGEIYPLITQREISEIPQREDPDIVKCLLHIVGPLDMVEIALQLRVYTSRQLLVRDSQTIEFVTDEIFKGRERKLEYSKNVDGVNVIYIRDSDGTMLIVFDREVADKLLNSKSKEENTDSDEFSGELVPMNVRVVQDPPSESPRNTNQRMPPVKGSKPVIMSMSSIFNTQDDDDYEGKKFEIKPIQNKETREKIIYL